MIGYVTHSEPGGHEENQDRLAVRPIPGPTPGYVCAVADGQGGQAGAALAAEIACQNCLDCALSYQAEQLLSPAVWFDILRQADEAVAAVEKAGYTTLIGFCLTETMLCGGSCGDSAVLLHMRDQLPCVLTRHQMKNPPVGSQEAVFVPFTARLLAPWTLLAMTDGVWKYAGWETIHAAMAEDDGDSIIRRLRARAALPGTNGLQDDFTLALFQNR